MQVIDPHRFPITTDFYNFGNGSRYFDGVSDYVSIPDINESNTAFSAMCWVKTTAVDWTNTFFAHWDNTSGQRSWVILPSRTAETNGKKLMVYITDDGSGNSSRSKRYYGTTDVSDGTWHHCAFTWDNGTLKLYVDGIEETTTKVWDVAFTSILNSSGPLSIGAVNPTVGGTSPIDAHIADCRIYDAVLSTTDIAAIYGGENITTNLIGHWLKDTPSLLDHSGTNDGTNVGSAFAYDNPSPEVEFGKASRVFDRTAVQYVSVADSATFPTGAQTHACWFKPDATITGGQSILGKWGNGGNLSFLLYYINLDLRAYISGDGSSNVNTGAYSLSPPTGAWHHAAFVFVPSTSLTLYINGSQVGQVTSGVPASLYDSSAEYRIGKMDRSYNAPFGGHVCDVRMYDTDLSSTDITALYNGTNVETNLIGHWLTNADDVKDYAGVQDGTNNGSTYSFDNPLSEGEFGSASRDFDGVNDSVNISNAAAPAADGDFSVSCWVNPDVTGWKDIVNVWSTGTNRQFALMMNLGNHPIFYYVDTTSTSRNITQALAMQNGTWYHLGITYEVGVGVKLFRDGVEVASSTTAPILQSSTDDIYIGSRAANSFPYDGTIADVRIYDAAINATDMYQLSRGEDFRTNLTDQWLTNRDDVDNYAGTYNGTNNGSTYSQDAPL